MMISGIPYLIRPKEKLRCWGKVSDIQYALRVNAERIFRIDPDSIIVAMPMWEGAGNTIIDYSKYANYGGNVEAVWSGQNLYFNGVDNAVDIPDSSLLELGTGPVTLIVGFKSGGQTGTFQRFLTKVEPSGANSSQYRMTLSESGAALNLNFAVRDTVSINIVGGSDVNDGKPHMVVGVRDTIEDKIKLYLDGESDATPVAETQGNVDTLNSTLTLGCQNQSGGIPDERQQFFKGDFYFFNFINIILSADQISLMNDRPWALYEPVQRPIYYFLPTGIAIPALMQNMRGNMQIGMRGGLVN